MKQDDVKSLLKTTTSQAVEDGAFGVPFIIVNQGKDHLGIENETFFGSDRFEMIANRLGISKTHIVNILSIQSVFTKEELKGYM